MCRPRNEILYDIAIIFLHTRRSWHIGVQSPNIWQIRSVIMAGYSLHLTKYC